MRDVPQTDRLVQPSELAAASLGWLTFGDLVGAQQKRASRILSFNPNPMTALSSLQEPAAIFSALHDTLGLSGGDGRSRRANASNWGIVWCNPKAGPRPLRPPASRESNGI